MKEKIVERVEALWKYLYAFRAFRERIGAFSTLGRLGSIKPYGTVLYAMYVCKHKHKENLGTFGSILERLETFVKSSNAFRALWERMGSFGKLGRLVIIMPYGMVCMVSL